MCELVHSKEDCWIGVKDAKKRKQIQDRLAQRARRKRLAEDSGPRPATSLVRARRVTSAASNGSVASGSSTTNTISHISVPMNVYSALWRNGEYLKLSCSSCISALSAQPAPEVPQSLHPTYLQRTTKHPLWIDRFPFPWMRDNFILMIEVIDPEDFLKDLFCMPSFTLAEGGEAWNPRAWRIEKGFKERWGFLFDPNLFGTDLEP